MICVEELTCSHCGMVTKIAHPFLERLPCPRCRRLMASRSPRLPGPGEADATDYEEAILELARTDPESAMFVRDYATGLAVRRI